MLSGQPEAFAEYRQAEEEESAEPLPESVEEEEEVDPDLEGADSS